MSHLAEADDPDSPRTAEQRAAQNVLKGSPKDWWPTVTLRFVPQYLTPKGLFQPSKSWRISLELSQTLYNGGERSGVQLERRASAQAAAASALAMPESYYAELAESYRRKRDRLTGILTAAGFAGRKLRAHWL